jgi:predicted transcriptional regulator
MTMDADTPIAELENWTRNYFELLGVMPEDQELFMVSPDTPVADALAQMNEHGYSQLPVSPDDKTAIGVFSYETYSQAVLAHARKASKNKPFDPQSLTVSDCMGPKTRTANVNDPFNDWFEDLDRQGFILVTAHGRVQAIVTPTDVRKYLYKVASPYVLVADCEFALRAIIRSLISADSIAECARTCLAEEYPADKVPTQLEAMTLSAYARIITDGRWNHFDRVFGTNRDNTRSRLTKLVQVRNKLFHHRGDVSPIEYEDLVSDRDWLRAKVDSLPRGGKPK